ncbi:MAG: HisA/HisF-related TIM barrel protein [Methylophilus sp.]|nr:HisA/HisF-related TIM barrel protein [Methylophilus sp.]
MRIIPVIDLLEGIVVHAKQGQRKYYQPIVSSLTASSKPLDIVKAFMEIYPFETLYIADLNAIQRLHSPIQSHQAVVAEIQNTFPELHIWLDAGVRNTLDVQPWQSLNTSLVLGTESLESFVEYEKIMEAMFGNIVLSLDFMPNGYQGLEIFLRNCLHWPKDVIVMTLSHVGMQQGVASSTLQKIVQLSHQHRLYAAGGVTSLTDVAQLERLGVHGALVATALHNQQLDATMLRQLSPT